MQKLFTAHPASVDETYWQHLGTATRFGARLIVTGVACFVHGLLPFTFERTGSRTVETLFKQMVARRRTSRGDSRLHPLDVDP